MVIGAMATQCTSIYPTASRVCSDKMSRAHVCSSWYHICIVSGRTDHSTVSSGLGKKPTTAPGPRIDLGVGCVECSADTSEGIRHVLNGLSSLR